MFSAKRQYRITATPGYVVVIRDEVKDVTKGGLLLPQNAKELPQVGTVVDHFPGPGAKGLKDSLTLVKGDRVVLQPQAGYEFTDDGETFLILNEADVMAELAAEGK